jgi:hypothetical protein
VFDDDFHLLGNVVRVELQKTVDCPFRLAFGEFWVFLTQTLGLIDANMFSKLNHNHKNISAAERDRREVEYFAMLRELTTSKYKFSRQSLIAAQRAYNPHNEYLEELFGFTIEEAIACTDFIESIYTKSQQKMFEESPISPTDIDLETDYYHYMIEKIEKDEIILPYADSAIADQVANIVETIYTNGENLKLLWFHDHVLETLVSEHDKLDAEVVSNFTSRMARQIGTGGEAVPDPLPEFRKPFHFNPINKYPIIDIGGQYHFGLVNFLLESLWRTFYYDLIQHDEYGDPTGQSGGEFGNKYGDYLEEWTQDELASLFKQVRSL